MGCLFGKPQVIRSAYDMNPVMKSPVIFVSGVPGAGYNTVSQTLAAITGYHIISPGELVRAEAANITTLRGMRVAKMLDESKVSEEIIVDLVKESMLENADAKGFILCGFPKNNKMANLYKKEVKTPEKVISLQVADEIATMRLQQKLTELGRSETEVQEAKDIVREAVPKIKKVTDRFKKDSVITVNSSQGNIQTLNETLQTATESFKEFSETKVPDDAVPDTQKPGEDFYLVNLSSSMESSPQISSQSSKDLIEPYEERQQDNQSIENEQIANLNDFPNDNLSYDETSSQASVKDERSALNNFQTSVTAELNQSSKYGLAQDAESTHGLTLSQYYNNFGKTLESIDLLNESTNTETSPSPNIVLDIPENYQHTSQQFMNENFAESEINAESASSLREVHRQVDYNSLKVDETGPFMNTSEPFRDNKTDEKRTHNAAEVPCMRDHMKVLSISEATETCPL